MTAKTRPLPGRGEISAIWRGREGDYLRSLLEDAGLTQQAFADRIGVIKQHINSLVCGREHVPPERYAQMAETLGVPAREFVTNLLRFQNPWAYAMIFGADPELQRELDAASTLARRPRNSHRI